MIRDSDVITWEEDPKKVLFINIYNYKQPRANRRAEPTAVKIEVHQHQSTFNTKAPDPELAAIKKLKIFALTRAFSNGSMTGGAYRVSLKKLGVDLTIEVERIISRQEQGGGVPFNELTRVIYLAMRDEVEISFENVMDPLM